MSSRWHEWPSLPDLLPVSFPGVKTSRDALLVGIDRVRLQKRVSDHCDQEGRARPDAAGFIRYVYRPFDTRWLYWEADSGLLDRPRPEYKAHVFDGNLWLEARERETQDDYSRGTLCRHLADNFGNGLSTFFPAWLRGEGLLAGSDNDARPNLSDAAHRYLNNLGLDVEDLFHHILAVLHNPAYRVANAGALRLEWPRIPLPGWPEGVNQTAADELAASAAHGRLLATLLDTDTSVDGVSTGNLRPEIALIAVPATVDKTNMEGDDFALTAGWGYFGKGNAVMPGKGRSVLRPYSESENSVLSEAVRTLGDKTLDIHLNDSAFWRNVPTAVWNYRLGGYQVLNKWLSYREQSVLGRQLSASEVENFTDTARRIAAILLTVDK